MRIIIAGGSGMIGSALTSALVDEGDDVSILSRNPGKVIGFPNHVSVLPWGGRNIQNLVSIIEDTDVVVNFAGENLSGKGIFPSRWTKERKKRLVDSRVNAGKLLTEAIGLSKSKPKVFVQASGIDYYDKNIQGVIDEDSPRGNDYLGNLAQEWEASSQPVEMMGVRRVIIRNGIVLSTEGGALRPILLQYRLFVGGPIGGGKQIYSWIHVGDVVNAVIFLIKKEQAKGVFNTTSPNPVKNSEFGRTIAKVLKRPHYFPLPGFVMRLAFGEVASLVLEGRKVLPKRLMEIGYEFKFPNLENAMENLLRK